MSEETLVVFVCECRRESKSIKVLGIAHETSSRISLVLILKVVDGLANSMPADIVGCLFLVAKAKDFHSVIVE